MFAIGDTVSVKTKFRGWQVGTIVGQAGWDMYPDRKVGPTWLVEIPGHAYKQTAATKIDLKLVR